MEGENEVREKRGKRGARKEARRKRCEEREGKDGELLKERGSGGDEGGRENKR